MISTECEFLRLVGNWFLGFRGSPTLDSRSRRIGVEVALWIGFDGGPGVEEETEGDAVPVLLLAI